MTSFDEFCDAHSMPDEHDTVGAVAMDTKGNVAYATTSGGRTGNLNGRVGDSSIPGQTDNSTVHTVITPPSRWCTSKMKSYKEQTM